MFSSWPLEVSLLTLAAASAGAVLLEGAPLLPWLGAPVLLAGLAIWFRLRTRADPTLRLPWLLIVAGLAFGAADFVGVGLYVAAASLVVGFLLVLAQIVDARFSV
jgi:hypothetical protein